MKGSVSRPILAAASGLVASCFLGFPGIPGAAEARPMPVLEPAAVEQVLRQSAVDAMFQDPQGFLWLGTREGLMRWDGETARYWHSRPFDNNSLRHNLVVGVDQDAAGHLWLVTRVAIHGPSQVSRLVAPDLERFVSYEPEGVELATDSRGSPWLVSAEQVWRYDPEADRFGAWIRRSPLRTVKTKAVIDEHDRLWVLDAGGLECCHLESRRCTRYPVDLPLGQRHFVRVDAGRVRLPAREGIACFDPAAEVFEACDDLAGFRPGIPVSAMGRDSSGLLWLATFEDVWRLEPSGPRKVPLASGSGSAGDDVYLLFGDSAGGMWAGTPWGLRYWDPHRQPFVKLPVGADEPDRHTSAPLMALHEDAAGTLWVGTIGDGVYSRSVAAKWRHWPERLWASKNRDAATFVWSIASHGDTVWLATSYGLVELDRRGGGNRLWSLPEIERVGDGQPSAGALEVFLEENDPSRPWVLARLDRLFRWQEGQLVTVYEEPGVEFSDLLLSEEAIWLATAEDGLRRIDRESGEVRTMRHRSEDPNSLAGRGIFHLYLDSTGHLWVGTTHGLDRLASGSDRFVHVLGPQDLPSSSVLAIAEGPRRLWISTNRGLVSIDKNVALQDAPSPEDRRAALAVWDLGDGVGNLEFNRRALLQREDGELLFGGDRGITRFQPRDIRRSTYRPPIRLHGLTVVDPDGSRQLDVPSDGPIEIGPDVTSFTVELGTIDFSSPPNHGFALWLEGVDPRWIDLGRQRTATYAGVPPGRYTLRGRVSNSDGVWSDQQLELALVVVPPLYRTPLFRLVTTFTLGLLVVGLGALGTRFRYRRQLDRMRQERQREEDRRRISRDLHDELGAGLTQIVLLSEKAMRQPDAGSEGLPAIADAARRLIGGIREIIWSVDPREDRLDRLTARLRSNAAEMLEAADLRADLDFPLSPPDLAVSPQLRRNLSLMLREALHNAIRHAGASRVRVSLEAEDAKLRLTVADDGRGFLESEVTPGQGLRNLRQRATALGGQIEITSRPGAGTEIRCSLPLAPEPGA